MQRTLKIALVSLMANIAFGAYYLIFGGITRSWWLLTLGVYYLVLSIVRFVVLRVRGKQRLVRGFTGWMLMILSLPLAATVILSVIRDRGHRLHLIIMLAIALYAFTKITLAIIKWVKSRRGKSAKMTALRNISLADAFVSIFALQRSMLVSFAGMTEAEIVLMNALTGTAVCVIVFLLGLHLVKNKK